jgi:chromosome segregation ATPase
MSNEEFERRMEFILEQQAKFEENFAKQQAKFDKNFAKQQEHHYQAIARLDRVDRQIAEVDRQIAELVAFTGVLRDALLGLTHHAERHDQQISANERAIAELAERGKETDARLNALILIVERHVSGHQ